MSLPPDVLSTADLHGWTARALSDERKARAVSESLEANADPFSVRPDAERWGVELAWMDLWHRQTRGAPSTQDF